MIIGAGLAGLIAAHAFPREQILEAGSREQATHQAVLRFRSQAVSDLVGIPFRKVVVHKGIWLRGWTAPTIEACTQYAQKVVGAIADRSIWDISPAERWIAPADLYERLVDALHKRIDWDTPADLGGNIRGAISTVPLPIIAKAALRESTHDFQYGEILTSRIALSRSDVFQTVYFPDSEYPLYRASITGDALILEWARTPDDVAEANEACVAIAEAFALPEVRWLARDGLLEFHRQPFGKILPVEEVRRKRLIGRLTTECGVYSIGRFATWRQIMLDDIPHDAAVIKKLMSGTEYERRLAEHGHTD